MRTEEDKEKVISKMEEMGHNFIMSHTDCIGDGQVADVYECEYCGEFYEEHRSNGTRDKSQGPGEGILALVPEDPYPCEGE